MVERRRDADRVEGNESAPGPKEEDDVDESSVSHIEGEERDSADEWDNKVVLDESEEEEEDSDSISEDDDGDLKTDSASATNAIALAAQKSSDARPSFGNIVVNSSSDVHFGNKTFYNGPVTIKQFVYTTRNGDDDTGEKDDDDPGVRDDNVTDPVSNGKLQISTPPVNETVSGVPSVQIVHSEPSPQVNGSLLPIWQPSRNDGEPLADRKSAVAQWIRKAASTKRCLAIFATVSTCAVVLLITLVLLLPQRQNSSSTVTDNTPSGKLRIISRREWLAQPPLRPGSSLQHPVPYVVILHTATEKCSTQADCIFFVRHTQTFHIESNGWWDIGYSFLVGGDSLVYTGRGWDTQGAFAFGYNNVSIGIAFIGTFIEELPVQKQMQAGLQLIQEGVRLGKISPDYKLLAHRQLSATESPGLAFYEIIKKWPHWSEKP